MSAVAEVTVPRAEAIARLNDALRKQGVGGTIMVTRGVLAITGYSYTVWIEGEKIRIAYIDAPEPNGGCNYETQLALRSRDRLVALLHEESFGIRRTGTDRYGRTLAVLHRSGRSIGDMLVAEGLARTWSGRRDPWC